MYEITGNENGKTTQWPDSDVGFFKYPPSLTHEVPLKKCLLITD